MTSAATIERELHEELKAEGPTLLLFNPATEWLNPSYGGHPYRLCPDGEAVDRATGQIRETDGVTKIRDRWGAEYVEDPESNGKKLVRTGQETVIHRATDIVKHILKTHPFVVRLTGDPRKDELRKADAKKRWVEHRLTWAREVINNRDAKVAAFHAQPSNAGQIPDPPSALENEALEFMADYRLGNIGRSRFVCHHEGYRTDSQEKWEKHQKAMHPDDYRNAQKEAAAGGGKKKGGAGGS